MLVRDSGTSDTGQSSCGHAPPPSEKEVSRAKSILRDFQFVGLTEEWDLTVCLWHTRFGPSGCQMAEFMNTRPGSGVSTAAAPSYDTSGLNGFKDEADGALYEVAQTLFWEDVQRHNLTRNRCAVWRQACVGLPPSSPQPPLPPMPPLALLRPLAPPPVKPHPPFELVVLLVGCACFTVGTVVGLKLKCMLKWCLRPTSRSRKEFRPLGSTHPDKAAVNKVQEQDEGVELVVPQNET